MKMLFIQKQLFPYFGILSLSGYLRSRGHQTYILIDSQHSEKELQRKISEIKPDLIGFSLMSTEHGWLVERSGLLKNMFPSIPIVVGGIHAILYPDDLATLGSVDFVCCGEGEVTLEQLLLHLGGGMALEQIGGIAFRKGGEIFKTGLNPFIDLNAFREDRRIYYDEYKGLGNMPLKVFVSSRGCPYRCSFCVNAQLQRTFKGLGHYIRRKAVDEFIAEMEEAKQNWGMKSVFIADDLFVMDKTWLREFSLRYKERIGVPYICTCRADMLDEEVVTLLAGSGCHTVTFGVETGNEELRVKILKKHISDRQLLEAADLLNRAGVRFQTSNMFCLPGETMEDAIKTIELNIKMRTSFTMAAIFLPFPKTELTDLCISMGLLKPDYSFKDMPGSFIQHSVLSLKDKAVIERLQKVAALIIQYPALKNGLIFMVRHVRIYSLHFLLYLVGTVLRFRAERKMSLIDTIRYIWSYRKSA